MDSSMPLDSHPAAGGGGRGGAAVIRGAWVWELANDGPGERLAGGGISLAGQAKLPSPRGVATLTPYFPEKTG